MATHVPLLPAAADTPRPCPPPLFVTAPAGFLNGQIETDAAGYVIVKHGVQTNVDGVFSAGDLHDTGGSGSAGSLAG